MKSGKGATEVSGAIGALEREISRRDFLWLLGSVCRIHGIPFDAELLGQQFSAPHTLATLERAADRLGLECALEAGPATAIEEERFPLALFLPREEATGSSAVEAALVVRGDGDRLVYFTAASDQPTLIGREECAGRFLPFRWRVSPRVAEAPDPSSGEDEESRRFGFRWFLPELLKYRALWRDVLLASLAIQLLGLATPLFTQVIIDKVIVHHTVNTLLVVGVGLFMFMLFSAVMTWVRQYLVLHTGNRIDAVLGSRVFEHIFRLPPRYFDKRPTGTVVARIQGVETIREFVSGAAVTLLLDVPFLVIFLAIMFYYSWQLTCVVLVTLTLISAISLLITPLLRRRLNEQFQLGARNQAFITEYVAGMETVKSLQMEPQIGRRWGDFLSRYLAAGFNSRRLSNTYNVSANTLEQMQVLAVLCVGAWLVMNRDGFTIGMLVAFQMFASRLSQPMLRLVGLWQEFQQASIAVKRLGDIMNAPTEPYSVVPARERGGGGAIRFSAVSFRYGDDLPYLYRDLTLEVEAGRCVALMGPSGSGKSTLAKLIQGFYRPSDGRIQIDGRDIRHLSANELRRYFGVVPQETVLFSGTLYDNLTLANPEASFEQVIQACRMAEIHEVIEQLPQGYRTEIGEHGAGLSGGQKQRVAIARALLKRPRILIFDEAVSSLDPLTAQQFAATVNRLRGKVTILFITHQMPRGLEVDRVFRLEEAERPETGREVGGPEQALRSAEEVSG